ncbi:MAG: hypothetical protein RRY20_02855, partial [Bilophila sp.]
MLGQGEQSGSQRELATLNTPSAQALFADETAPGTASEATPSKLPVLLGSGFGYALEELLRRTTGPVAVLDKETDILALTTVRERFPSPRVLWITETEPEAVLASLTRWQHEHGDKPLCPLVNAFYLRLDRTWYQALRTSIEACVSTTSTPDNAFWDKAIQPRFGGDTPRVLLITSNYFLMGEVVGACRKLNIPHLLLTLENKELGGVDFVERLLTAVLEFR